MSTSFKLKLTGNKVLLSMFMAAVLTLGLSSCTKNNESQTDSTVTVDDAADAVTQAVSPESAGMVAQTTTAARMVTTSTLSCGLEKDSSISGQNAPGSTITYSYALNWNSNLSCNGNMPQQFQFNFSGKSSYDAPRMSSNDSSNAQFTATGLEPSATQYIFNQTYSRNGSQVSKVRNKRSFTSTINITSSNITVNKSTGEIISGAATVTVSGAGSGGDSFNYTGTLTFLGNKQATLVLGNGNTYSIQWQ